MQSHSRFVLFLMSKKKQSDCAYGKLSIVYTFFRGLPRVCMGDAVEVYLQIIVKKFMSLPGYVIDRIVVGFFSF